MHISNGFVIVCNIQIVSCYLNVKNIDHSITSLNTGLFNGKIGSRLQITLLFLFYRNFQPTYPLPPPRLFGFTPTQPPSFPALIRSSPFIRDPRTVSEVV